jgi:hypothetical protein
VAEEDPDLYIWIRRFEDEEERKRLYAAVYESDTWKNEIAPKTAQLNIREQMVITRLNPTRSRYCVRDGDWGSGTGIPTFQIS